MPKRDASNTELPTTDFLEQLSKEKQTLNLEIVRLQQELEGVVRGLAIDRSLN